MEDHAGMFQLFLNVRRHGKNESKRHRTANLRRSPKPSFRPSWRTQTLSSSLDLAQGNAEQAFR